MKRWIWFKGRSYTVTETERKRWETRFAGLDVVQALLEANFSEREAKTATQCRKILDDYLAARASEPR